MSLQNQAKNVLAKHGNAIDAGRFYSMGPGGAKTLLDEKDKARPVSITLRNSSTEDKAIVFGVPRHSMFTSITGAPDNAAFLAAVGADLVLTDGTLEVDGGDNPIVEATRDDAGRKIAHLMEHVSHNPSRIVSIDFQSAKLDNTPDTTNFTSSLKTVFLSPYRAPVEDEFPLRKLQSNKANSPHFGNLSLVKNQFPVLLSRENFFVVTVKKNTQLSLTLGFGIEDSPAQRLYRTVQKADSVVPTVIGDECGC